MAHPFRKTPQSLCLDPACPSPGPGAAPVCDPAACGPGGGEPPPDTPLFDADDFLFRRALRQLAESPADCPPEDPEDPEDATAGPRLVLVSVRIFPLLSVLMLVLLGLLGVSGAVAAQEAPRPRIETVDGRLVLTPAPDATGDRQQAMARWLERWERGSTAVTRARRHLARAVVTHHPSRLEPPCRRLGEALTALDRERLLPAPDYAVHRHLTRHLEHLARAAAQCLVGHTTAAAAEMRRAARAESEMRLALGRWGLAPESEDVEP